MAAQASELPEDTSEDIAVRAHDFAPGERFDGEVHEERQAQVMRVTSL